MPSSLDEERSGKGSPEEVQTPSNTEADQNEKAAYSTKHPAENKSGNNDLDEEVPAEPATEQTQHDLVAKEDYSIFTVNQKRAMILAASLCGWFR